MPQAPSRTQADLLAGPTELKLCIFLKVPKLAAERNSVRPTGKTDRLTNE